MLALAGAVVPSGASEGIGRHEVLLVRGPIHYDFLLPLDDKTRTAFSNLRDSGFAIDHPDAQWLVAGWGGEAFYTSVPTYRELNSTAIWRSVLGDNSVMRMDIVGALNDGLEVQVLRMDDAQYARFLLAIRNSFDAGPPLAGYHAFDLFYPARGRFDLTRTCNVWVGEMIRAAGLRFGLWTPVPGAVRLSHWLYQSG
ncbi:conserved hypothetical protein [Sulfitobacter brevis]|uniref:DUF2459 domain-containing protein n=1 Tax=Sulfitobacter brevis TaxID=74348 RepID=A0A1I1VUV8_9RHOB|nr:TIGR02117 family protein [Sulfitobacter brevis]SFD86866.1 conserved hypothetical protein [Sulfitobacter brevis]